VTRRQLWAAIAIVVGVPLIGYPAIVLADGARFPSQDDCVKIAPVGSTEALDLVFGRRDTPDAAEELRAKVSGVGYVDAEVRGDGCARWKVLYDGIESYAQGASSLEEARGAGLEAELEIEPPG
jgi:hypothetical protein